MDSELVLITAMQLVIMIDSNRHYQNLPNVDGIEVDGAVGPKLGNIEGIAVVGRRVGYIEGGAVRDPQTTTR